MILPNKYIDNPAEMAIQKAIKTSRSKKCKSIPISALDKNLNAKANSINPKTTFTVFNQPPDFGILPNKLGAKAKNIKGKANPDPKPSMASDKIEAPPSEFKEVPNTNPNAGPMQEKETIIKVNAMKKIPNKPPEFDLLSTLLESLLGIVISKAPKKEIAKTTNMMKKNRFK